MTKQTLKKVLVIVEIEQPDRILHHGRPVIGIGGSHYRLRPCHTTRHAGPHRAVREVEVMRDEAP